MKFRTLCSALVLFAAPFAGQAQQQNHWCGFDHRYEEKMQDPAVREAMEAQEAALQETIGRMRANRNSDNERIVVPTVVHVIHDNGVGNISDEQVHDAIRVLNEDFQHRNADSAETRDVFQSVAGCADFEFRLARLDPDGNATNGIVRVSSPNTTFDAGDNAKAVSWWPGQDYFNIWVVNSIASSGDGTILGYAYFPGSANWNAEYGVIIRHDQFGTIGTSNADGRTLPHECGHSFNLFHTFQNSCGGNCATTGDRVCDTPPVFEDTQDCSSTQNTCSNDTQGASAFSTDVVDQIENYMSYDNCQNMFSEGQVERMRGIVASMNVLSGLTSEANLAQTGVDQFYAVDFNVRQRIVCTGMEAAFIDGSEYTQNEWLWQFPGGSPEQSEDQYPTVWYPQPGLYDVILSAGDGSTTLSEIKDDYIFAVPQVGEHTPFVESFEQSAFPNTEWIDFNHDGSAYGWTMTSDAAYTGSQSLKMKNFGNAAGSVDDLISASIDLSTHSNAGMSFRYSYAQRLSSNQDVLKVFVSTDCGNTWFIRWAATGTQLATAAATQSEFVPASTDDWEQVNVSLSSVYLVENLLLRFEFISDQGNHLYLDDINITGNYNPIPQQVSPTDGASAVADSQILDWKAVGDANEYEVQLDTTPLFFSPQLQQETKAFISPSPNNSDTEYEPISDLMHGQTYYWRVRSTKNGATSSWSDTWSFTVSANGVNVNDNIAEQADMQIFPNPVTDASVLQVHIPTASKVDLRIYDLMGREVGTLFSSADFWGTKQYNLKEFAPNSGVYVVRLQINNDLRVSKFLVK